MSSKDDWEIQKRWLEVMEARKAIARTLARSLGADDAEDVASEAIARFLKYLAEAGWSVGWPQSVRAYLYRAAYNVRAEWIRSNRLAPSLPLEGTDVENVADSAASPEAKSSDAQLEECIEARLNAYIEASPHARERAFRVKRATALRMDWADADAEEIRAALEHKNVQVTYVFLNQCKAHLQAILRPCADGLLLTGVMA